MLFKEFFRVKPQSSRKESTELYYVGKGYKLGEFYQIVNDFNENETDIEHFMRKIGWNNQMKDSLKISLSILNDNNIECKTIKLIFVSISQ